MAFGPLSSAILSTPPTIRIASPHLSRMMAGSEPALTSTGNMQLMPPARNWPRMGTTFPSQSVHEMSQPCFFRTSVMRA